MTARIENSSGEPKSSEEERMEEEHFHRIVGAFRYYRTHSLQRIDRTEQYLRSLPEKQQVLLSSYNDHLSNVRRAIEHNYRIIQLIIQDVAHMFENVNHSDTASSKPIYATNMDMDKIQSTLKQFVRDWSEEGAKERETCYRPILDEIEDRFSQRNRDVRPVNVLVPGAGLGRLAYEIARRGYACQGNEFSLFMLFASNFVLNRCHGVKLHKVYPWVHHYCNNIKSSDQLEYVMFPDVNPSDLPPNSRFSMAAGDFVEVYVDKNVWDCVATCFFLDTANNVVSYVETIWNILKPGGIWINLGPLLYHFADISNEDSIEPSYEEVRDIIHKIGFVMLKEKLNVHTTYAQNPHSMLQYEYKSVLFVCQKTGDKSCSDGAQR